MRSIVEGGRSPNPALSGALQNRRVQSRCDENLNPVEIGATPEAVEAC